MKHRCKYDPPDGLNLLTFSRIQCFRTCVRKEFWSYRCGIRRDRTSAPLRVGSSFHLGVDAWFRNGLDDDKAVAEAIADWNQYPAWAKSDALKYDFLCERQLVIELLYAYFDQWRDDPDLLVLETESAFEVPILNPATRRPTPLFRFAGRRDGIVTFEGMRAIQEIKTTSSDIESEQYWTRLRIDQQATGYFLATILQGHGIDTILWDVVRKPELRPSLVDVLDDGRDVNGIPIVVNEKGKRLRWKDFYKSIGAEPLEGDPDPDEWIQDPKAFPGSQIRYSPIYRDGAGRRCWKKNGEPYRSKPKDVPDAYRLQAMEEPEAYGERVAAELRQNPDRYFARREVPRIAADVRQYQRELWTIAHDIHRAAKNGDDTRNSGACFNYNSACPFFEACTSGERLEELEEYELNERGFRLIPFAHEELADIYTEGN